MDYSVVTHESNIFENVSPHVINGVLNLTFVLQLVLNVETTIPWNKQSISNANGMTLEIAKHAQLAYEHFKRANNELIKQKSIIDSYIEKQIDIESQLNHDIKQLEIGIQTGVVKIEEKLRQIKETESRLLRSQHNLDVANEDARRAYNAFRQKQKQSESGFYAIPLLGYVLASLTGLNWEIDQARHRSDEAAHQVHEYQDTIMRRESEIRELNDLLENTKRDKVLKEIQLKRHFTYMNNLKEIQRRITTYGQSLGKWLHFVSSTLGKSRILANEATDFISLEPLHAIITDIVQHLAKDSKNIDIDVNTRLAIQELIDVTESGSQKHYMWYSIPVLLIIYVYTTFYPVIAYLNLYRRLWLML